MITYQYDEEEKLCIQSNLEISPPYPEPSIPIMTKYKGCNYGGTLYNIGEGRNPDLGICGNCIGGNLFYETPIRVHDQCLAPFSKYEFDRDGKTYKYCLYYGFTGVDSCTAETECKKIDSYLALLEGFPHLADALPMYTTVFGK